MKSAITGVTPPQVGEVTVMTVWPSIAMYPIARAMGRLFLIRTGWSIFTVGHLLMLLSIPLAIALYFRRLAPWACRRYTLTNRRVVVQRGIFAKPERWVSLEDFDSIEIEVLPGQEFYHAGQLIFRNGDIETFRLAAVAHPQSFRHTCLDAHKAYVEVQRIVEQQQKETQEAA